MIFVYPVIVYFDDCFDVEGPNYLLNKEFQRIISEKNVTADYEVKDVVMVNIEQLMRLENFFAAEKLDLAYLINSYIEYKEEFELNQVFPFMKLIPKYQTGKNILPIDWRPRSELDSKYNLGSKSYDKTGQVSGQ